MRLFYTAFALSWAMILHAQQANIVVYDLLANTVDTLTDIAIDPTLMSDQTPHFMGTYNEDLASLSEEAPTDDLFPNTTFTRQRLAAPDHLITAYPIRTSTKILVGQGDSLRSLCSGSLISGRHVLSAAHCFFEAWEWDALLYSSIEVCPAYDNGQSDVSFGCSTVEKLYVIEDWTIAGEDFVVLELAEDLGRTTGWLGIGFDDTDEIFDEAIFYKFSYPGYETEIPEFPGYNGDSLYYNYGLLNRIDTAYLGVVGAKGVPGESGSSLIRVQLDSIYTSYGVLTWTNGIRHSRLRSRTFQLFRSIIAEDLIVQTNDLPQLASLRLFPNPSSGDVHLQGIPTSVEATLALVNSMGRIVWTGKVSGTNPHLALPVLPAATYFLRVEIGEAWKVLPLVRQ